jgi:MATE family multidrug resistance protein
MTSTTTTFTAPQQRTIWRTEIIETVTLAWPIALTQLGQIAMMTTDLALIGRLGDGAVAAVGLAHLILFFGFVFGMGPVSAVAALAAQAYGAREPRMVRRSLRVGLWAAVMLGAPINLAQLWGEDILLAAGQSPDTASLAARYLAGLAWSMIPAWCFIALRNFMGAVNRPEPALWIMLAAIPVNAVLAYALIHGAFGMPRLDLLGAGLATTIVNIAMCVAAVWICYACRPFKKYRVLGRFWRTDWGADEAIDGHRNADLGRLPAGVGTLLLRRPATGLDRHERAGGASDRFAGRIDLVHGSIRYFPRCNGARRTRGRPS